MLRLPTSFDATERTQAPLHKPVPGIISRRAMLQSMLVGAGGLAASPLLSQEQDPPPLTPEQYRVLKEAWEKINDHPFTTVESLNTVDPNTRTVYLGLKWDGDTNDRIMRPIPHGRMVVSSMGYLQESGWMQRAKESRKDNLENFSWPYSGSAFVVRSRVGPLVVSNAHLLKYAQGDEVLASIDEDDLDIAVAHLDSFERFPEDDHRLPLTTLSGDVPTDIAGNVIRSQGLGAEHYRLTGQALQMPICSGGGEICGDCTRYFALKISTKDIASYKGIIGMSGDPGVDQSSRFARGVFHTAIRPADPYNMSSNDDFFLMWFSNNAHIQQVIVAAEKEYLRRRLP